MFIRRQFCLLLPLLLLLPGSSSAVDLDPSNLFPDSLFRDYLWDIEGQVICNQRDSNNNLKWEFAKANVQLWIHSVILTNDHLTDGHDWEANPENHGYFKLHAAKERQLKEKRPNTFLLLLHGCEASPGDLKKDCRYETRIYFDPDLYRAFFEINLGTAEFSRDLISGVVGKKMSTTQKC